VVATAAIAQAFRRTRLDMMSCFSSLGTRRPPVRVMAKH
jgi:hypothetical protein